MKCSVRKANLVASFVGQISALWHNRSSKYSDKKWDVNLKLKFRNF